MHKCGYCNSSFVKYDELKEHENHIHKTEMLKL
jgi:hypothetical protein